MTDVVTGSVQVDLKRRTTLPGDILAAAGIPAGSPLVARVDEPGRIVLESPALLLSRLQDDIAAALAHGDEAQKVDSLTEGRPNGASGFTRDLAAELLSDRVADASLEAEQHEPEPPTHRGEQRSLDNSAVPNLASHVHAPRDGEA